MTVILRHGEEDQADIDHGDLEGKETTKELSASTDSSSHDPLLNSQNLDDLKLAMALEKVKDMDAK